VSVQRKPSGERSESANCYDTDHIRSEATPLHGGSLCCVDAAKDATVGNK
jgi:hypothetical protein